MPLLDHFNPPVYPQRAWESFHSRWANTMADALQEALPPRYFAEVHIHLGVDVEADVAEFERTAERGPLSEGENGVAVQTWAPPAAAMVLPAVFPDDLAVYVKDRRDDARLVAAVELVSPRNKDRPDSRRAFAAKCAAFLQKGIGLIVVDIVTLRAANMHNEIVQLLQLGTSFLMAADAVLYAVAYRPARHAPANTIEAWPNPLALGKPLPVLPLALRGDGTIPLDLEATYTQARQRSRI